MENKDFFKETKPDIN